MSNSAKEEQILRLNIVADPQTLDPRKGRNLESVTLMHMFFEGLTRTSKAGDLETAIAERVEISQDGLRYSFHLRKSFWSNGKPLTSFDFAESWRTVLDPKFPTDIAYYLYGIKNGQKAKQGEISLNEVGISTPDPQTLIVELEHPIPYFLKLVSMPAFFPVPHKFAGNDLAWSSSASSYVCNGPFKLGMWKHSDLIEAVKNPRYWQAEEVHLSKIDLFIMGSDTELEMFKEGSLDWAGSPLSVIPVDAICSLESQNELHVAPFLATYFFRVNTIDLIQGKKNPLSSSLFRKALAFAIDRQAITEHVLQGGHIPARGLVPPKMGLSERGYFQEDQAQAVSFLNDALLNLDLTLDKLEPIWISFSSSERNRSVVQAIQKQWQEVLGIQVNLEAVEPKTYFQKISHKEFQLAVGSWTADFDDPINFLEVFKYKDMNTNNTNWENSCYVNLLNKSAFCEPLIERNKILREAEGILMEQMPILPVFHYALNYLKRDGLEDVVLSPLGKIDFRWAYTNANK